MQVGEIKTESNTALKYLADSEQYGVSSFSTQVYRKILAQVQWRVVLRAAFANIRKRRMRCFVKKGLALSVYGRNSKK